MTTAYDSHHFHSHQTTQWPSCPVHVGIVSRTYSRIEMFYQMMKVWVDIPPTLKRCWLPHCRIQDSPVYIYMHGLTGEEWSKKERDRVHVWIGYYPVWFCSFSLFFSLGWKVVTAFMFRFLFVQLCWEMPHMFTDCFFCSQHHVCDFLGDKCFA